MKKLLLSALVIASTATFAQVTNSSFETWGPDTSILDLSTLGGPIDTGYFQDPIGWTSSNAVTAGKAFGMKNFSSQTTFANTGVSSVKLRTDSITVPVLGSQITLPGFVISGDFKISLTNFTNSNFSATNIPGAGVAINPARRIEKLSGFYSYAPITVGADSCAAIAVLKKGSTVVATATFFATAAQSTFRQFSADFVYTSCLIPDSVVIILSSSNPYALEGLISGSTTSLPIGGEAWFDDITLVDTTVNFSVNPIANFDTVSVVKNTPKSIAVTANDFDCYGRALTVSIPGGTTPHGAISVSGTNVIYTPTTGFLGKDNFTYTITAGGKSSSTQVTITVTPNAGINTLGENSVEFYPNPSRGNLVVNADNNEVSSLIITDLVGKRVIAQAVTAAQTIVNTSSLNTGVYILNLVDANGKIRFTSKFVSEK